MRVLHVVDYFWPAIEWGGPVTSVRLLCTALSRAGAEVEVLTTTTRGARGLPEQPVGTARVDGLPVTYSRARGPRRFFFSPGLLQELAARARRMDLVHLHGLWTASTGAGSRLCRLLGVPYALSPRGSLDPWALAQKATKKRLYLAAIERSTLHHAALLHFTSEEEQRGTPPALLRAPSAVVPNPVEIERFLGVPRVAPRPGKLRLLLVGRIHRMKGFDVIVPALAALAARGIDARLRVAGPDEGGYRLEVERLARAHGVSERLEFLGLVDRDGVRQELEVCDAAVLPSYRENFGNAAAEAMAAARPVVVSEQVNIAGQIAEASAGLVVPLSPEAWATALERVAADREEGQRMGERGRALVSARFAPEAVARDTLLAYEGVLRRRGATTRR